MRSTLPALFVCAVSVAIGASARADIPPPDVGPCTGKTAGAACTYGTAGTCQDSTCSSPSPPPSGSTYACVRCVTGAATSTQTSTDTSTQTSTDTSTLSSTASATHTQTGTDTSTSNDSGWCSVGKGSTGARTAGWLMAAAFSLLFLWGRRRQQK